MAARSSDKSTHRAVLFGAGRMGGALAQGWQRNWSAAGLRSLDIVDPLAPDATRSIAEDKKVRLNATPRMVDIAVICVKPQSFAEAVSQIKLWISPETRVISVMAGITINTLFKRLGTEQIVRAMPNTPGSIGKGISGYAIAPACSPDTTEMVNRLLMPLGKVVGPLPESQLDAVTAVSGSGPAYVFLLAEALEAAGRAAGLPDEIAADLARHTVAGAGAMLSEGAEPSELRKSVTSPGGTTAAALDVLMKPEGFPGLLRRAVEAAAKRSVELARDSGS